MRFVSPETVRIDLNDGNWIDVKKELSVIEDHTYRSEGMVTVMNPVTGRPEAKIDFPRLSLSRVCAYVVGWSAQKNGTAVAFSREAVESLAPADFYEIDNAIQQHISDVAEDMKKKEASSQTVSVSAA